MGLLLVCSVGFLIGWMCWCVMGIGYCVCMSNLSEVGDWDDWCCWLCDELVDLDVFVNFDFGFSVDVVVLVWVLKGKGKGGVVIEWFVYCVCNICKGVVWFVVLWLFDLFVVDLVFIVEIVEWLCCRLGCEVVVWCFGCDDVD